MLSFGNTKRSVRTDPTLKVCYLHISKRRYISPSCSGPAAAPPPAVLATPTETVVSTVTVEDGSVVTLTAQPISFDRIV